MLVITGKTESISTATKLTRDKNRRITNSNTPNYLNTKSVIDCRQAEDSPLEV